MKFFNLKLVFRSGQTIDIEAWNTGKQLQDAQEVIRYIKKSEWFNARNHITIRSADITMIEVTDYVPKKEQE